MTKDKLHYCPKCDESQIEEKNEGLERYWFCPRCMTIYKDEPPFREIELDVGNNSELKDPKGWLCDVR